ncbi:FAD/NAD(P)-binding protein (plasmid) [Rhizobium sp. CB3171]|uniref:FAD/NAD(P)-binding protein n=1 Tax=Rhizobium sp. CB3171 TaxID=3039157 RepID=UPI0024B12ABD|nr:FAD/NAD(P)-binding protein [Rhizobium sp. CB3171]WFU04568.1 FAD/NAD(P)-binding protein [Rhizobium sp. CB3171]
MVTSSLRIGIVGCGPRGLSIFERILSIAELRRNQPIIIDIFDPRLPGTGVHAPDQPDYLLLNTVAGQLGVFPDKAALGDLPDACERTGPSFLAWCQAKNLSVSTETSQPTTGDRSVAAEDFLPRRLLGSYLAEAFQEIASAAPPHVAVNVHREEVTELETEGSNLFVLKTGAGTCVAVERLVLTVGHTGRLAAEKSGRVEKIYPLPNSLDVVGAGDAVLIDALGLGAMDVLAAMTVGRGGSFEQHVEGARYRPSGHEPAIYLQSRNGLPFRARPDGLMRFRRHQAVVLTRSRLADLRCRVNGGRLDFDLDILPLMKLEMRAAAVSVLYGDSDGTKRLDLLHQLRAAGSNLKTGVEDFESLLRVFEERCGFIELRTLLRKVLPDQVTEQNYHGWICHEIRTDLCEAALGLESPVKAAAEVWRDLRDELRDAVDFEGLNEVSHRQFYSEWHNIINRLVAGPQKERHEELLALCEAGVLTFVHPADKPSAAAKCWRVSGYVQSAGLIDTDSKLLQKLKDLGLIRPKTNLRGADGVDLDPSFRPLSRAGLRTEGIWVLGPLAEGSCYYNHYVSSAGAPSRLFMDAHKVAHSILEIPQETTGPQA